MSQISNPVTSVAQAALTQKQQAARQDAVREAGERAAGRQARLNDEHRESVENAVETTGLKVHPDSSRDGKARRRKRFSLKRHKDPPPAPAPPDPDQTRDHAAALLSDPARREGPTPPPCIIDVKA